MTIQNSQSITKPIDLYVKSIEHICRRISQRDFVVIQAVEAMRTLQLANQVAWQTFTDSWNDLQVDNYMADGGTYRARRHATFSALASSCIWVQEPHQPHFQSLHYNELNGDVERHYRPISDKVVNSQLFKSILNFCCEVFGRLSPYNSWHIEAHQFRISTNGTRPANPTPEGVHRDGVNYVLMMLIDRQNVSDGQTSIYNSERKLTQQFTLTDAMSIVLVNDERTFHNVSPIYQENEQTIGYRDMLVVTFRRKDLLEEEI